MSPPLIGMFASNLGDPGAFVDIARRAHPELPILLPAHGRPTVVTRDPSRSG